MATYTIDIIQDIKTKSTNYQKDAKQETQLESISHFWKLHVGGNLNGLAIPLEPGSRRASKTKNKWDYDCSMRERGRGPAEVEEDS